jgi:hypothetical protein
MGAAAAPLLVPPLTYERACQSGSNADTSGYALPAISQLISPRDHAVILRSQRLKACWSGLGTK